MRRFLLDTNILIDAISERRARHAEAASFMEAVLARPDAEILILNSCLKDVYFIVERHYGSEREARHAVQLLYACTTPVELSNAFIQTALASDEPDFEDGLIRAVAEASAVDAIVSRDKPAFTNSSIPSLEPAEALSLIA